MKSHRFGFTLIEVLLSAAIFALVSVGLITLFTTTLQIQGKQGSEAEVTTQNQFLMQQIQYYVERSSLIDMPLDVTTSTLKLWMGQNAIDPVYIFAQGGTAYLRQTATGTPQALTSNRVTVSTLTFARHANPPGHDTVSITLIINYNNPTLTQRFSEALQSSFSRVSAATFDSNIVPSSTATYSLGLNGAAWTSINGVINFSGSNVGIGTVSPGQMLSVAGIIESTVGGFKFPDGTTQTTAASGGGGTMHAQIFNSSGTWTKPGGVNMVWVTVCGGGGGGATGGVGGGGGGGGGGGCYVRYPVSVGGDVSVTVGTGGGSLTTGGNSSFGSLIANGGVGAAASSGNGGAGGNPGGGSAGIGAGNPGNSGSSYAGGVGGGGGGAPGNSTGGGGGTGYDGVGGTGGNNGGGNGAGGGGGGSYFGIGGTGGGTGAFNGGTGTGYGSGGGGGGNSGSATTGGSGKAGIVIVEWVQ